MALLKDTLKIEGYESMTPEQKLAAWEAMNAPEIDSSKYVDKTLFDKKASELAAKNKRIKELEDAQLSEEDRLKQDRVAFELEKSKFNKERNGIKIRGVFAKGNLKEEDYADLDIDSFEDEEKAIKFANSIVKLAQAQRSAAETDARNSLLCGETPKQGATPDQASKIRTDYANAVKSGDTYAMALAIAEAQAKGVSLT